MSKYSRKKGARINELHDHYVPSPLPTPFKGLEFSNQSCYLDSFVTSTYPASDPSYLEEVRKKTMDELADLVKLSDSYSSGEGCIAHIDGRIKELYAEVENVGAEHQNQIGRINATKEARKRTLVERAREYEDEIANRTKIIEPLKDLRSQFTFKLGVVISIGLLVTIVSMIFDSIVNYSYYQTVLLSNKVLLCLTVIGCTFMSDLSMATLGMYISRKGENFTSKRLFYTICGALLFMFIVSVVTSVMVRIGSMPETFAAVDAKGDPVPPESYTIAQWGITLVTAFITACTGILSFAFSNDKNAHMVSIRERAKQERAALRSKLEPISNELILLDNAPDVSAYDLRKKNGAVCMIEALRLRLKLDSILMQSVHVGDATFAEKMSELAAKLIEDAPADVTAVLSTFEDPTIQVQNLKEVC